MKEMYIVRLTSILIIQQEINDPLSSQKFKSSFVIVFLKKYCKGKTLIIKLDANFES